MADTEDTIPRLANDDVRSKIYTLRGVQVMLDSDHAELYQEETRILNQTVKRNIERFPSDFCFQLTDPEFQILKSQIVTSSVAQWGGVGKLPYAFTEHGVNNAFLTESSSA